jgi:hypothetical protein
LSPAEGRRFGVLVGSAFLLLGGISFWRGYDVAPAVFWVLGGALFAVGLLIPGRLGPAYRGWMGFALVLAKVTTPIVMGVIYFLVFTPIGLIRRAVGLNSLVRAQSGSYWITRDPGTARRSDLNHQF